MKIDACVVGAVQPETNVPLNIISSILNCVVVEVCLNLILKLAAEGITPVGLISIQFAVPEPVVLL